MYCFFTLFIIIVILLWIWIGITADKNDINNNNNEVGDYMDADIAIVTLQNLQLGLSKSERRAIDYAIECIKSCNKIETWISENER